MSPFLGSICLDHWWHPRHISLAKEIFLLLESCNYFVSAIYLHFAWMLKWMKSGDCPLLFCFFFFLSLSVVRFCDSNTRMLKLGEFLSLFSAASAAAVEYLSMESCEGKQQKKEWKQYSGECTSWRLKKKKKETRRRWKVSSIINFALFFPYARRERERKGSQLQRDEQGRGKARRMSSCSNQRED